MPEILPRLDDADDPVSPPAPRSALFWDGTHWHVPRVDTHGRVQVRGEDQLFSFKDTLELFVNVPCVGADGYIEAGPVPAGEIWEITNVVARDAASALTNMAFVRWAGGVAYRFGSAFRAIGIGEDASWVGHVWLKKDDTLRVYYIGAANLDNCFVWATGYTMTLES